MINTSYFDCRAIMLDYIVNNKHLPTNVKPEMLQHVSKMLHLMQEYIGHMELMYLRTKQFKKEKR